MWHNRTRVMDLYLSLQRHFYWYAAVNVKRLMWKWTVLWHRWGFHPLKQKKTHWRDFDAIDTSIWSGKIDIWYKYISQSWFLLTDCRNSPWSCDLQWGFWVLWRRHERFPGQYDRGADAGYWKMCREIQQDYDGLDWWIQRYTNRLLWYYTTLKCQAIYMWIRVIGIWIFWEEKSKVLYKRRFLV